MQPNVIISIVTIFLATLFSILVLISNYRSKINRYFALLGSTLIFWILTNLLADIAKDVPTALFWSKSAIIWPTFFPLLFIYLIIKLYYNDYWKKYKKIIIIFSIISVFIIILSPTHFNIEKVALYTWGADYQPGILYYLLFIYLFISFGWAFYLLISVAKSFGEPHRSQARFMLTGTLLAVSFSIITNIVLPLLNYGFASIFGPPNVLFFLGFTAYAITKHHLFNIKTIATELLTFAIWIAVLFDLLTQETWRGRFIEGGLFVFVVVFGIFLIRSVIKEVRQREEMERLAKELEKLNSQLSVRTTQLTSLKDFTTSLIKTLDYKEIIQIIVNGIVERFGYAGVFLTGVSEDGKYLYPLAISQNKPVELALKLLPKSLEEYKEEIENNQSLAAQAIQTNSIQIGEDFGKFFSVVPEFLLKGMQSLIGFKTALAIPVISKDKVMGVLNVAIFKGEKEIGISELELLNTIANQIAIIMTNAKLFQQIEKANEKLVELDKAKAGMYSFVSHQIKAPMGIVKGFAQLLSDGSYGKLPKKAKERVEDMKKSCDRLIQLVNDFLDLRRIEEGRMEYEFKEINLVDLVKSVFEELKFLAEQKKLKFELECAEQEIKVKADEQRFRQVISNLIENSIKYTEKGFVKARLMTDDKESMTNNIIFSVEDSGIGIRPETLPQLFDQFKRAKEARLIQGTGLGLYIAREIVKAHKGEIWAESEGEGKGSKFLVRLFR
ncbi:MAG: ATP-binding protein [Patescibacteria group bacterium]